MEQNRRRFLKSSGVAVAGVGAGTVGCAALAKAIRGDRYRASGDARSGARWAMVVDISRCERAGEGCDRCIQACHRTHNVPTVPPERQVKEELKWIWKETFDHVFHEQVSEYVAEEVRHRPAVVLCNHCDNPACVRVCPTGSTFRRDDGIVMMDMHRCIGCRYCLVACPYGARSFNFRDPRPYLDTDGDGKLSSTEVNVAYPTRRKGVVEKCTLCAERLARGLDPACVEACEAGALLFGDLSDPECEVSRIVRSGGTLRRKPLVGTEPQVYYLT